MRKLSVLIAVILGVSLVGFAQITSNSVNKYILKNNSKRTLSLIHEGGVPFAYTYKKRPIHTIVNNAMAVSAPIQLGNAGNAFSIAGEGRTFLWADPNLNSITFSHRSDGPSGLTGDPSIGYLRYDYSVDTGKTWNVNQGPAYQSNNSNAPPFANARYPQGILFNPSGNTNADSSYFTYFAPSLVSVNGGGTAGGWGGHVHGTVQVSGNLPSTRNEVINSRFLISDGFTLTKTGVLFNTDAAYDDANTTTPIGYKDTILISKGVWNTASRDFSYTLSKLYAPVSRDNNVSTNPKGNPDYAGSHRVAFADDGLTGYIVLLGHNSYVLEPDSIYYLIVYKTINGGVSWSAPVNVSMNGAQPLLPNANAVNGKFTSGFELDAVVDINKNLHVITPISPETTSGYSISTQFGTWGIFDVYTTDGGTSWFAKLLANPETLTGTFGSTTDVNNPTLTEYNRGQASRNWNGDKLFFSWFDTDTTNFSSGGNPNLANMSPNAFIKGYDVITNKWTDTITTEGTAAEVAILMGCASYYVFSNNNTYTVPIAFQELADNTSTGAPVVYEYVNGLTFTDADFKNAGNEVPLNGSNSVNNIKENKDLTVSQNFPNPFNNSTSFNITLENSLTVSVSIYNTMGQLVKNLGYQNYGAGTHAITIEGSNLAAGVYFYTVNTGTSCLTQRMVIIRAGK